MGESASGRGLQVHQEGRLRRALVDICYERLRLQQGLPPREHNESGRVGISLDKMDGTPLCPCVGITKPADWYYMRVWSVTSPRLNLKQITVTTTVATSSGIRAA